jgi:hypothetical protein
VPKRCSSMSCDARPNSRTPQAIAIEAPVNSRRTTGVRGAERARAPAVLEEGLRRCNLPPRPRRLGAKLEDATARSSRLRLKGPTAHHSSTEQDKNRGGRASVFAERRSFRPGSSGFGYWLRRCEGFRADSPQGRVGFVEELRHSSSVEEPDAIAVRAGLFSSLFLIVPTGEVEEIVPEQERMLLRRSPRLTATQRTRELGRRLQLPRSTRERGRARREVRASRSDSRRDRSRRRPAAAAGAPGSLETGRR